MAIYHNTTKIISRSSGRSCVGSSAYRSGEKLHNDYDDKTHDYTRKKGIVYKDVMLPKQAKEEFKNREILWNEVEKIEKSKNSQLAREVEVAIPKELNREEQINLVRNYVKDNFVNNGMCADVCIHDKGDGNPHAHIMLTMRTIKQNGEWGAKQEKLYLIRKKGEKEQYVNSKVANEKVKNDGYEKVKIGKRYKTKSVDLTNWNTKEFLESYRKDWAKKINQELERKGIKERVDHRSYAEQGIIKEPTIHEGKIAREMEEKRGKVSDRMEINREIKRSNETREKMLKSVHADMEKLKVLQSELKAFESSNKKYNIEQQQNNIRTIEELKNQRAVLNNQYQDINKKFNMCKEYKKNSELLKEYKNKIENEIKYKKSLGFFKISEKKNIDDRINKLDKTISNIQDNISFIKNQLLPSGGATMTNDEFLQEVQKIEMQRINIENQLKQNENELKQEQEKAIKEQLENNKRQQEIIQEEKEKFKYKNHDSELRSKDIENDKKINLSEEQKKLLENAKQTYTDIKIHLIKYPNDEKAQEIAKQMKSILDKYLPSKSANKEHKQNKSKGIER